GLHYTPSPGVRMTLGWERGNELLANIAFRGNLKNAPRQPRWLDPPKLPMRGEKLHSETGQVPLASLQANQTVAMAGSASDATQTTVTLPTGDGYPLLPGHTWEDVRSQLASNAGFQ